MPDAMEQIVSAFVRLRNRHALERLRDHRLRLATDLNELRTNSDFHTSLALGSMATDLAAIEEGLDQLTSAKDDAQPSDQR